MKKNKFCLLILFTLLLTESLQASILERKYTMEKLNTFWDSTFKQNFPSSEWFKDLDSGNSQFEPSTEVTTRSSIINDDLPFDGVILGETTNSDPTISKKIVSFPIIPIRSEVAVKLYQRLPLLEIFLNRYLDFFLSNTDTPEEITTLTKRFHSVTLEIYLIEILRYFSENSFLKKCERFERAEELLTKSLKDLKEDDLLLEWRPLYPLFKNITEKFKDDLLKKVVCSVKPTETRAEIQKKIKAQVESEIYKGVHKQVIDQIKLLELAKIEFQSVVRKVDAIQIASKDIMQFEERLTNVSSNLYMVKNDLLKEQTLLGKLIEVDLEKLKETSGGAVELENGIKQTKQILQEIETSLKELSYLSTVVGQTPARENLAICKVMPSKLQNINFKEDTATLQRSILEPYQLCLNEATKLVSNLKRPSPQKNIWALFSAYISELSADYLKSLRP